MSKSKKQMSASLEHPVIMYGYLNSQSEDEYKEAVRQWKLSFTAFMNGIADDAFCYDKVIILKNVNICAFMDYQRAVPCNNMPVDNLPILHAGVAFLNKDYPVWLYLFQEDTDMMEMIESYPFNNFILDNGERYGDAAKKAGIQFKIYNGKECAEYSVEDEKASVRFQAYDGEDMTTVEETAELLESIEQSSILSIPGWPAKEFRDSFYEGSAKILEQQLERLPEAIRGYFKRLQPKLVTTPIVYKVPLPGAEFSVHSIALTSVVFADNSYMTVLIQNDCMFECGLELL